MTTTRDCLEDVARDLKMQATTIDIFDCDAVLGWFEACVQVIRGFKDADMRESQVQNFAFNWVHRENKQLGYHVPVSAYAELLRQMVELAERKDKS